MSMLALGRLALTQSELRRLLPRRKGESQADGSRLSPGQPIIVTVELPNASGRPCQSSYICRFLPLSDGAVAPYGAPSAAEVGRQASFDSLGWLSTSHALSEHADQVGSTILCQLNSACITSLEAVGPHSHRLRWEGRTTTLQVLTLEVCAPTESSAGIDTTSCDNSLYLTEFLAADPTRRIADVKALLLGTFVARGVTVCVPALDDPAVRAEFPASTGSCCLKLKVVSYRLTDGGEYSVGEVTQHTRIKLNLPKSRGASTGQRVWGKPKAPASCRPNEESCSLFHVQQTKGPRLLSPKDFGTVDACRDLATLIVSAGRLGNQYDDGDVDIIAKHFGSVVRGVLLSGQPSSGKHVVLGQAIDRAREQLQAQEQVQLDVLSTTSVDDECSEVAEGGALQRCVAMIRKYRADIVANGEGGARMAVVVLDPVETVFPSNAHEPTAELTTAAALAALGPQSVGAFTSYGATDIDTSSNDSESDSAGDEQRPLFSLFFIGVTSCLIDVHPSCRAPVYCAPGSSSGRMWHSPDGGTPAHPESPFTASIDLRLPSESERLSILVAAASGGIESVAATLSEQSHMGVLKAVARCTSGYTGPDLLKTWQRLCDSIQPGNDQHDERTMHTNVKALERIAAVGVASFFPKKNTDGSSLPGMTIYAPKQKGQGVIGEEASLRGAVGRGPLTFDQLGGLELVKRRITQVLLHPILHPEAFSRFGLQVSKGLLLYGPPGCAKTSLMKALAAESETTLIYIDSASVLSAYVGEAERFLRECFRRARDMAPAVIFFDEVEAIAPRRRGGPGSGASDVTSRVLATLLIEIDGVVENANVSFVGSTNLPHLVDPALLRPGRIDQLVYVGPPNQKQRADIFRKMLVDSGAAAAMASELGGKMDSSSAGGIDCELLGRATRGYSGADIAGVCRDAALTLARATLTERMKASMGEGNQGPVGSLCSLPSTVTELLMGAVSRVKPSLDRPSSELRQFFATVDIVAAGSKSSHPTDAHIDKLLGFASSDDEQEEPQPVAPMMNDAPFSGFDPARVSLGSSRSCGSDSATPLRHSDRRRSTGRRSARGPVGLRLEKHTQ